MIDDCPNRDCPVTCDGCVKSPATTPEPAPMRTDSPAVWPLVVRDLLEEDRLVETSSRVVESLAADMRDRDVEGCRKYGTPLQVENGRNAAVDAYQEALDLTVYARQRWERHHTAAWWTIYEDALKLSARICAELMKEDDQSGLVECRACSEAGGAGMPVCHESPEHSK